MVAGACGGCNGCGRSGHGKAAYPCTQSMPQGTTACRIGTGPQRTGSLRSLLCARMAEAKKACAPFWDTGRKSRLVKGSLRGKSSRIDSRDATGWRPQAVPVATQEATGIDSRDATEWRPQAVPVATQEATGIDSRDATEWRPQAVPVATQEATGIDSRDATEWRPQAVPVATQEATGIDSRDATEWRPQAVPVSEKDASRDHRQRGGALKVSAVGDTGPTDIAGRMRGSLSSSKAGCPGRYALRGRPARWAKPMRAWVSLAAVKSA